MRLDAHIHVDHYTDEQLPAVLAEIEQQQIFTVSVTVNPASYRRSQAIAARCPWILPAFGIHPWEAHHYAADLASLQTLIEASPLLGEIGLDYYFVKDISLYPAQRRVFELFLEAARRQDKVVSLHTKGADADVLALLDQYQIRRAIIHWYSGPLDTFRQLVQRGYYFSIGVAVGWSDHIQRLVQELPPTQLLTETDCPGSMQSLVNRMGMPRHLNEVITEIARLKTMTPEAVQQVVWQNFSRLMASDRWLPESYRRWFDASQPVKLPAHHYLDELGLPYRALSFSPTTEKGAANVAHALGYKERQMIKTLIFETSLGERVLVMVGGDQSAISGHLKKAIGSRDIKLADPEVVKATTGYIIGSIPPFHWQPDGLRTFLEASLMEEEVLGVGTGQWGEEIILTPDNLVAASRAIVVNLTDRSKPVFPDE